MERAWVVQPLVPQQVHRNASEPALTPLVSFTAAWSSLTLHRHGGRRRGRHAHTTYTYTTTDTAGVVVVVAVQAGIAVVAWEQQRRGVIRSQRKVLQQVLHPAARHAPRKPFKLAGPQHRGRAHVTARAAAASFAALELGPNGVEGVPNEQHYPLHAGQRQRVQKVDLVRCCSACCACRWDVLPSFDEGFQVVVGESVRLDGEHGAAVVALPGKQRAEGQVVVNRPGKHPRAVLEEQAHPRVAAAGETRQHRHAAVMVLVVIAVVVTTTTTAAAAKMVVSIAVATKRGGGGGGGRGGAAVASVCVNPTQLLSHAPIACVVDRWHRTGVVAAATFYFAAWFIARLFFSRTSV